jgi:hypothetical protein
MATAKFNSDAVIFGGYGELVTIQAVVGKPMHYIVGSVQKRVATGEMTISGVLFAGCTTSLRDAIEFAYKKLNSSADTITEDLRK